MRSNPSFMLTEEQKQRMPRWLRFACAVKQAEDQHGAWVKIGEIREVDEKRTKEVEGWHYMDCSFMFLKFYMYSDRRNTTIKEAVEVKAVEQRWDKSKSYYMYHVELSRQELVKLLAECALDFKILSEICRKPIAEGTRATLGQIATRKKKKQSKNHGKPYTFREDEIIINMMTTHSARHIGRQLDRPRGGIRSRVNWMQHTSLNTLEDLKAYHKERGTL